MKLITAIPTFHTNGSNKHLYIKDLNNLRNFLYAEVESNNLAHITLFQLTDTKFPTHKTLQNNYD